MFIFDWVGGLVYSLGEVGVWIMPSLIFGMLLTGIIRGVPVYESFIEGAKEGFNLGVMIIPYLIAILTAIGMFRASGGLDMMVIGLNLLLASSNFLGRCFH